MKWFDIKLGLELTFVDVVNMKYYFIDIKELSLHDDDKVPTQGRRIRVASNLENLEKSENLKPTWKAWKVREFHCWSRKMNNVTNLRIINASVGNMM